MSAQDAFERILASLYDAMLDDTLWPVTSALIDDACGLQANGLLVGEGPPDAVRVFCAGFYYRGQRRPDLEREYLTVYHPMDESVPRVRQLPDSHLVHIRALYTTAELKTSPTYNEGLPWLGAQDGLRVRLDGPVGSHISFATADPITRGGWASPQLTLLTGLLPHIRQFVRVRQTLAGAEALGLTVTELLEATQLGVLHLDRRGQIVAANDRARALLRRGDGLTDRDGVLQAQAPADRPRLARLVGGALPAAAGSAVSGSMRVHRPAGRWPFLVHVKPVVGPQMDLVFPRVAALVLIVEPGHPPRLNPALVGAVLGLTPAESQVAVALAQGQSVREIAAATGRQASSVYWHLRRIYAKLHLAGQVELVRVVLSLAAVP